jgi:hypothetical protein
MFRILGGALAASLFALTTAQAAEPRIEGGYIMNAPWLETASREALEDAYPPFALQNDVKGSALLDCLVLDDGGLQCSIVSETPADRAFGGASLTAAKHYKMATALADGRKTAGLRTRLNLNFIPPKPGNDVIRY